MKNNRVQDVWKFSCLLLRMFGNFLAMQDIFVLCRIHYAYLMKMRNDDEDDVCEYEDDDVDDEMSLYITL